MSNSADVSEAKILYDSARPYFRRIIACFEDARQEFGEDDLLVVVDMSEVANSDKVPWAIRAAPRTGVLEYGGAIEHPSSATGSVQIPSDVMQHISEPPGIERGYKHTFWIVALNIGGCESAGKCGCIRLSTTDTHDHLPN